MELALNELKTQAKKLLKAAKADKNLDNKIMLQLKNIQLTSLDELKLKHCLTLVSQQLGFENWHHAQTILSGSENLTNNPDMGTAFYNKACGALINLWFSDYEQAKLALADQLETSWLIPYKKTIHCCKKRIFGITKGCRGFQTIMG